MACVAWSISEVSDVREALGPDVLRRLARAREHLGHRLSELVELTQRGGDHEDADDDDEDAEQGEERARRSRSGRTARGSARPPRPARGRTRRGSRGRRGRPPGPRRGTGAPPRRRRGRPAPKPAPRRTQSFRPGSCVAGSTALTRTLAVTGLRAWPDARARHGLRPVACKGLAHATAPLQPLTRGRSPAPDLWAMAADGAAVDTRRDGQSLGAAPTSAAVPVAERGAPFVRVLATLALCVVLVGNAPGASGSTAIAPSVDAPVRWLLRPPPGPRSASTASARGRRASPTAAASRSSRRTRSTPRGSRSSTRRGPGSTATR